MSGLQHLRLFSGLSFLLTACVLSAAELPGTKPHAANPILPGYFADPSIVSQDGRHYIYATIDPWGGDTLGCWESADFKNWTFRTLNWPTKAACTSPTSGQSAVWAPSVVRSASGKFFMYVSVGSEVWVGTAEQPLGPWRDANGGKPLIPGNFKPGYHMIDAEAFIDSDGQAYLYWGSGLNWVNGKCWVVKLGADMASFDGEVMDVTPANYFEAPFMVKQGGRYFLMYSNGKTIEDSYNVRYAVGDSPFGPFTEASNSPVLVTQMADNVRSPGHHAVFEKDGRHYILYHRHSIPFNPEFVGRQTCVDELKFDASGLIEKVIPSHDGPDFVRGRVANKIQPVKVTASSQRDPNTTPGAVADDNYATLWAAGPNEDGAWLKMDLGSEQEIAGQEIRFEYAWKPSLFVIEGSADGEKWSVIADHSDSPATGSPVMINVPAKARFLRMKFPATGKDVQPGVFEWLLK